MAAIVFRCSCCGQCCRQFGIALSVEDMNREPRLWDVAIPIQHVGNRKMQAFMTEKKLPWVIRSGRGQPCPFLFPDKTCMIYKTRPQICRDYPEGKCIRENQECLLSEAST